MIFARSGSDLGLRVKGSYRLVQDVSQDSNSGGQDFLRLVGLSSSRASERIP